LGFDLGFERQQGTHQLDRFFIAAGRVIGELGYRGIELGDALAPAVFGNGYGLIHGRHENRGEVPAALAASLGVARLAFAIAELQRQGLIRQLGLSNVTSARLKQARGIADDDALIDELGGTAIAYVPFFPLGGFTPLQSSILAQVADRLGATPMQVALAWLLHRAPNILLIPGTSTLGHLRENLAAANLALPKEAIGQLDAIGTAKTR
jgi:pyridoxine 4-dehydrogenase